MKVTGAERVPVMEWDYRKLSGTLRFAGVPLEVVIPIEKITFLRSPDGMYQARVTVHHAAAAEKEFVSYGRQEQVIELTPDQYRAMLRIRYRYTSSITVPRGKIRIALGVVDPTSRMSSLQTVNLMAPERFA